MSLKGHCFIWAIVERQCNGLREARKERREEKEAGGSGVGWNQELGLIIYTS